LNFAPTCAERVPLMLVMRPKSADVMLIRFAERVVVQRVERVDANLHPLALRDAEGFASDMFSSTTDGPTMPTIYVPARSSHSSRSTGTLTNAAVFRRTYVVL
jgi:hypothetical protein